MIVRAKSCPDTSRSARHVAVAEEPVSDDDIVEIEFADGQHLWMRVDDYRRQFAPGPAALAACEKWLLKDFNGEIGGIIALREGTLWYSKAPFFAHLVLYIRPSFAPTKGRPSYCEKPKNGLKSKDCRSSSLLIAGMISTVKYPFTVD